MVMEAYVEGEETNQSLCYITCQMNQVSARSTALFRSSHRCWLYSQNRSLEGRCLGEKSIFCKNICGIFSTMGLSSVMLLPAAGGFSWKKDRAV